MENSEKVEHEVYEFEAVQWDASPQINTSKGVSPHLAVRKDSSPLQKSPSLAIQKDSSPLQRSPSLSQGEDRKATFENDPNELNPQQFSRAYEGAILDRKRESFQVFQDREMERRNLVETHKTIITGLVGNIEAKVVWIGSGADKIVKFFKDRAAQEEGYVKIMTQGLPKMGTFFTDLANPGLFTDFSKALSECDDFHVRQSKNSEIMAQFLRKDLLEDTIIPSEKEFKKHYDLLKGPVDEHGKRLNSISQDAAKKMKSYIFNYNEAQRNSKPLTKDRDMFRKEMDYIKVGQEELHTLKIFGTQALLLLNEVVKLLIKRFAEIKKALGLYFMKYTEMYGSKAANPQIVLQLVEKFNSLIELQQVFSVNNMLKPEEIEYFKKKTKKSEVTYQEVFDVLALIPKMNPIVESPLVLKEWKATRDAGLLKGNKTCSVVVTIDSHVVVLEKSSDGETYDAFKTLKLQNMKIVSKEEKKDYSIVDILEVIPGLIIDSKTKLSLKFNNEDSAEEFRHYIYNYYNTNILDK